MSTTTETPPTEDTSKDKTNALAKAFQGLSSVFDFKGLFDGLQEMFGEGVTVNMPSIDKTLDVDVKDDIALKAEGHAASITARVTSQSVIKAKASATGGVLSKLFPPKDPPVTKE